MSLGQHNRDTTIVSLDINAMSESKQMDVFKANKKVFLRKLLREYTFNKLTGKTEVSSREFRTEDVKKKLKSRHWSLFILINLDKPWTATLLVLLLERQKEFKAFIDTVMRARCIHTRSIMWLKPTNNMENTPDVHWIGTTILPNSRQA